MTDPAGAYTTIRNYSKSGKDFQIKFTGLVAIPFEPLIDTDPNKKNIREFLLRKAGLDVNGPYLNSDPVTITIIICLTICFIVFVLGVATPLAVGSSLILSAIAIAIVYAIISGKYNLDIDTCIKASTGISGAGVTIPASVEPCVKAIFKHIQD